MNASGITVIILAVLALVTIYSGVKMVPQVSLHGCMDRGMISNRDVMSLRESCGNRFLNIAKPPFRGISDSLC